MANDSMKPIAQYQQAQQAKVAARAASTTASARPTPTTAVGRWVETRFARNRQLAQLFLKEDGLPIWSKRGVDRALLLFSAGGTALLFSYQLFRITTELILPKKNK